MERLTGSIRQYTWGSTTGVPTILGTEPDGNPQAEYWLGAHPLAPSQLSSGEPLTQHLHVHPDELGSAGQRFEGRLPYMMKIVSAARPMSLQAHPNDEQAWEGFAADNEHGLTLDSPDRTFLDPWGKPEIFVAMDEVDVLHGFRDPIQTRTLFDALDVHASLDQVIGPLTERRSSAGLAEVFLDCLSGGPEREAWVSEVTSAAVNHVDDEGELGVFARTAVALDEHHPSDPSILAALLLNHRHLHRGDALLVDPGTLHCYLTGTGVELAANSSNVVRGGLTHKHIDIDRLISIVNFVTQPIDLVELVSVGAGMGRYDTQYPQFQLYRFDLDVDQPAMAPHSDQPRILLMTGGYVVCTSPSGTDELVHGMAAWIPAGEQVQLNGNCEGFIASPGM